MLALVSAESHRRVRAYEGKQGRPLDNRQRRQSDPRPDGRGDRQGLGWSAAGSSSLIPETTRPSDNSRVTNRWPSETRSISTAIASIPCSSRSRRRAASPESCGSGVLRDEARFHIILAAANAIGAITKTISTKDNPAAIPGSIRNWPAGEVVATSVPGAI